MIVFRQESQREHPISAAKIQDPALRNCAKEIPDNLATYRHVEIAMQITVRLIEKLLDLQGFTHRIIFFNHRFMDGRAKAEICRFLVRPPGSSCVDLGIGAFPGTLHRVPANDRGDQVLQPAITPIKVKCRPCAGEYGQVEYQVGAAIDT